MERNVTPIDKKKESTELALPNPNITELTIAQVKNQITKIQSIMKSVMKEGVHFGSVPGVATKFLWKAGAEKLNMTFRLVPTYTTIETPLGSGHMMFRSKCELYHSSGIKVGEGEAVCSTMEKKYRYRNEHISTGIEVWDTYWEKRSLDAMKKVMKANGFTPKTDEQMKKLGLEWGTVKENKKWYFSYAKKVENKDIADVYNTCIKMSNKRALVAATISALAVSDIFSQDPEAVGGEEKEDTEEKEEKEEKKDKKETTLKNATRPARRSNSVR